MLILSHRGASGYAPENTIDAFQKAIMLGADGIELDVHLSVDGEIIVIHDNSIDRTTSNKGLVKWMSLSDLQLIKIDGKHGIPTLSEVFDLDSNLLINVELKARETAIPVGQLIEKYVSEKNRRYTQFLVSSFDWAALELFRNKFPQIPLGVLTSTNFAEAIAFAKSIKAESIHPNFKLLSSGNLDECRENGIKVFTYTVNNLIDIESVKKLNPDGIITDFPDRI